ncbi:MAG: elongation factor 1-beta, partial [Sulfolobales archaeon]
MGRVVVAVRVNPESDEVDIDRLVGKIRQVLPSQYELVKAEKFYIAFGLYGLRVYLAMPEEYEGGTYELENI